MTFQWEVVSKACWAMGDICVMRENISSQTYCLWDMLSSGVAPQPYYPRCDSINSTTQQNHTLLE